MPIEVFEYDYTNQQIDEQLTENQSAPQHLDGLAAGDDEWDSEQFILEGGVAAHLAQNDTVTYNLGSVSINGPARDAEIMMVAMRAFVTVRTFQITQNHLGAFPTYQLMHDLQEDGYSISLSEDDAIRGE